MLMCACDLCRGMQERMKLRAPERTSSTPPHSMERGGTAVREGGLWSCILFHLPTPCICVGLHAALL